MTLIGTAYVDFSALALDKSQKENVISGYFHVINKGEVRSSKDLSFMETNFLSRQSKGQLRVTVRAESDKSGSALQSTVLFPEPGRRMNQSMQLGASQETFGNRMHNQQLYQSLNLTAATLTPPIVQDDDFDVDREQPREEKKFDAINSSHTLTTVNEQQSDFNDTLGALNRDMNISSFQRVAELSATAKRDEQVATMTSEMRQQKRHSGAGHRPDVFNPFSSSLDEMDEDRLKSPTGHDDEQHSFERE